jgi:hypothetical protein
MAFSWSVVPSHVSFSQLKSTHARMVQLIQYQVRSREAVGDVFELARNMEPRQLQVACLEASPEPKLLTLV